MPQYCDSKNLEQNWLLWIVAKSVPSLEEFRRRGMLWTKIIGVVRDSGKILLDRSGNPYPDPAFKTRLHCIDTDHGIIYLSSVDGIINMDLQDALRYNTGNNDNIISQKGFIREIPVKRAWDLLLSDIYKICMGLTAKFYQPTLEDKTKLANDAMLQVASKLIRGKLNYTPGRAPVFNLLTTTIRRCMYTIVSKDSKQKRNSAKYVDDIILNSGLPATDYIKTYRS